MFPARTGRSTAVYALTLLLAGMSGCDSTGSPETPPTPAVSPFQVELIDPPTVEEVATAGAPACSTLTDAHDQLGLDFVYRNGEQGNSLMVETTGGGVSWLDYDRDGQPDLYFTQGGDPTKDATSQQPADALFRATSNGFVEVHEPALLFEFHYGQGAAVGDFDNDGFPDIYVTNVGQNTLWRNLGDGTFEEISAAAGVADPRWSSSAAWADLDLDGDLDLYVCNYTVYDPKNPLDCRNKEGEPRICHPKDVDPWPDECYFNQGDGSFTPEAQKRGLFGDGNKGLGVAVADFNNDGLPDLYIANDTTANFLFLNQGDAVFEDQAVLLGCAVDRNGSFQASMGVAVDDYDGNGFLDVYLSHFYEESNTLYQNLGPQGFQDVTGLTGLHDLSMLRLGFGVEFADFNSDGSPEIFVANGHIENFPNNPLHKMTPQLFAATGKRWIDCSEQAGAYFKGKFVGRGVASADFDSDGDLDLAVVHQNAPAALLRNDSASGNWLQVRFRGRHSNRDGIGCRVIVQAGERRYVQELCGGTSYASSHQAQLQFGLGTWDQECRLTILWPGGLQQELSVRPNQLVVAIEPQP